ncbi:MAG: anti-sigma factor [Deltaproteobacteria bacterium]|nr:anti-sigma factor [Deltaproteobacteria bacterium]
MHGGTDDDASVLLLRLEPGTLIPRHRHGGEVHALNLAGTRELIETGELVGPGGYVHEPAGNVDSWRAVGDVPVIVFLTTRGSFAWLGPDDAVTGGTSNGQRAAGYAAYVASLG